jgi:hypothetical protein
MVRSQISAETGKKPPVVDLLNDWQYLEKSFHRLLCAWGRWIADWDDKVALSRHIWEEAEVVHRLRERLSEFPGNARNADAPVSARLETFAKQVLLAPTSEDAFDGIYQILVDALVRSYVGYVERAHPVHVAPTIALVQDLVRLKEQQRLWLRQYRRRRPHTTDAAYAERLRLTFAELDSLVNPIPVEEPAEPVGVRTDFRLLAMARHPVGSQPPCDWTSGMDGDFAHDLEARRLFWCYGYMLEMNLAEDQLRWLYDAHELPWDFIRDVSRHMWDESRHGDSGRSRLLDFGIELGDVGYRYYNGSLPPNYEGPDQHEMRAEPLSATDLYEQIFGIGMVAETGHFTVKKEAYEDFKAAGDLESAEMVLFDIIDETSHKWLPLLAERCGKDPEEFKARGLAERDRAGQAARDRQAAARAQVREPGDPGYAHYLSLLKRMRERHPLAEVPLVPRTPLPM